MKNPNFLYLFCLIQCLSGPLTWAQFEPSPTNERIFLFRFFKYFSKIQSQLSVDCVQVTKYFWDHQTEPWAAKMIDSNSVQESGLASGNIQFLGSFDECLGIQIPDSSGLSSRTQFQIRDIQYCTVRLPISMLMSPSETRQYPEIVVEIAPPLAGICLPAACQSKNDLKVILGKYSQMTNQTVEVANCITEENLKFSNRFKPYHTELLIPIIVIFLLCIIGTIISQLRPHPPTKGNLILPYRILISFSFTRNFAFLFQTYQPKPKISIISSLAEFASTAKLTERAESSASLNSVDTESSSSSSSSSTISAFTTPQNVPETPQTNPEQLADPQIEPERQASPPALVRPQIDCLHGIRFISFTFILIYHTFTEAQTPSANLLTVINEEQSFVKQLITNAGLWVDTFFLLSGFLVAHSILYQKPKDPTKGHSLMDHLLAHPKRLLHRYLRLTPSVAGVIALSLLIEPLGSGPVWNQYIDLSVKTCHPNWWAPLLYVNNIFKLNSMEGATECLSYLWYLGVDMQFFLVSPLLLMFLTSPKKETQILGVIVNLLAIAASWNITAILMASGDLTPTVIVTNYDLTYINQIYKSSYCRIGPYCVGILLAFTLYHRAKSGSNLGPSKPSHRARLLTGTLLLVLSLVLILGVTFLTYPWLQGASYTNIPAIIYGTIHRTIWALGWALLIYACVCGYAPLLNRVLGAGAFQFLSKLTYQSYLLHSVLISAVTSSVRQKMYYSDSNFVLDIFRYLILTESVSVGTFVLFERPFINLEAVLFK